MPSSPWVCLQILMPGEMCGVAEAVEAAQAADPIAAEAEHVGGPAGDHAGDLALALQPLIGAEGDRHAPAQLLHQGDGRCGHRRLGIFDPEHLVPAVQQPDGFRQAPGLIGIDADPGLRSRGLAQRRQHLLLAAALDPDLEIEAVVAPRDAVARLGRDLLRRPAREVIEIVDACPHGPAEEAVERLAAILAAEIPQRHVDAGEGEIAGHGPVFPEAGAEDLMGDGLGVPGVLVQHEGRHGLQGGLDGARIGAAAALAPADEAVVGGQLDDDVADAAAAHAGAELGMAVADADGEASRI